MTKIIINGSKGRMGQTLLACAARMPNVQVVGLIDQGDELSSIIANSDVVIDFSFHDVTPGVTSLCTRRGKALVIGTTGHTDAEKTHIANGKLQIPIVWASNYSTGVNTLFWLTRRSEEHTSELQS